MRQKAHLSDPISLFILEARSFNLCYLPPSMASFTADSATYAFLPMGKIRLIRDIPPSANADLGKSNKRYIQTISFIKHCFGENGNLS